MARVAVFDVGEVLIRWDVAAAFRPDFPDDAAIAGWLEDVGFHDWNLAQDAGRPLAEAVAAAEAAHGEAAAPLRHYRARFADTIRQPIAGTWALLERLAARGPVYAITNWSAELWPEALRLHPRLGQVFADVVVSGREGIIKPDPAIYRLLLDRNGLAAGDCLFIDDRAANIAGAKAVGMDGVLFTTPEALEAELRARAML